MLKYFSNLEFFDGQIDHVMTNDRQQQTKPT